MSIADELRLAGLTVVQGRLGLGGSRATGIEVRRTGTGQGLEGASDLNIIVTPARAMLYIERSGRTWVLSEGPVQPGPILVYLARYRDADELPEAQQEALDVVLSVLTATFGLGDQGEPQDETESEENPDGDE